MTEHGARDDEREALDTVIRKHWVATPGEFREVLLAWMQTEGYRKYPDPEITDDIRPWVPADGDTRCKKCGKPNPIWFADSAEWNLTVGGPGAKDDPGGILCPTCYHEAWLTLATRTSPVEGDAAMTYANTEPAFCSHEETWEDGTTRYCSDCGATTEHFNASSDDWFRGEPPAGAIWTEDGWLNETADAARVGGASDTAGMERTLTPVPTDE